MRKKCLDTVYNLAKTNKKIVALGGITKHNINNLKLLNCNGIAGITLFKNIKLTYDITR